MKDVVIVGAGIAGMATAARLQAQGLSTLVLEAHGQPGGCAGFYRRSGFSFDVGATTLVDFEPGGVGGELLETIGMPALEAEALPGYLAWLPDCQVTLYRDQQAWADERLQHLGDTPAHRQLWQLLDTLARAFWQASRGGIKLPLRSAGDLLRAIRLLGLNNLPLARYLSWSMGDSLRALDLRGDQRLAGLLAMLIEDTMHSTIDAAPLINAALGISIRGAGLSRARGGMRGFWQAFCAHYRALGGELRVGCRVEQISGSLGNFQLQTRRGVFAAAQVVCALPVALTAQLGPPAIARELDPYLERDATALGGAAVVFLGVPEEQVAGRAFTHHQLLESYTAALGEGNNMFISVSSPGDTLSAPPGQRAVMISTHCELASWQGLSPEEYQQRKQELGGRLLSLARRVYPQLAESYLVYEVGTPKTYERFTSRPHGAVGGFRQHGQNSNQHAIPQASRLPGFWYAGDQTWPGLGTVACVLGSRIVAEGVRQTMSKKRRAGLSGQKEQLCQQK